MRESCCRTERGGTVARYVLAIDEGTTGVRALLVDRDGRVAATAYRELTIVCPQPGWIECDAEHIWKSTLAVCREALAVVGGHASDLAAIGITNQRASAVAWDARDHRPLYAAISWQDTRTAARVAELLQQGVFTSTMASAAKLEWILKSVPRAAEVAEAGCLRLGTIDSWLAWRLSEGRIHVTDASNASCTTLYDHAGGGWDGAVLGRLGLEPGMMPRVCDSSEVYGTATALGGEIPIAGIAGDQQAAMFGEMGLERGAIKATFGTSGMFDVNVGELPMFSSRGAYPLVMWSLGGRRTYCLEGTIITVGAAVQWLRDVLGLVPTVEDSGPLAAQAADSGGVWFVPAFQGLGTPHMLPQARAVFGGLSRATGKAEIVRAVLEGIAFRGREVFDTLIEDTGLPKPECLRIDGGAASNDFLLQQVADTLGIPVERPACVQASALGAAYLAGLGVGVWADLEALRGAWKLGARFEPRGSAGERDERYDRWRAVVEATRAMPSHDLR